MRNIVFLVIGLLFISNAMNAQNLKFKSKKLNPKNVGEKLVENYLSSEYRHFDEIPGPPPFIVYPETCTWFGALKFSKASKNKKMENMLEKRFFPLVGKRKELMQVPNHVDNTVFGIIPLQLYMQTRNEVYYHMGIDFADRQWELPKSSSKDSISNNKWLNKGLSWQTRFWIDDMYMITAIQSQAYLASGNKKYIERAAYEMTVYLDSIQQDNGLFYHASSAPFYWARGNGWMAVGMAKLLKNLPDSNIYKDRIMKAYLKMMNTLKEFRNDEYLWGQLIDEPQQSWTETSGSAMFTYAIIEGLKNGWLDKKQYTSIVRQAWESLVSYLDDDGNLHNVCIGTNIGDSKKYYLNRKKLVGDFHGQAAMLWCATALIEK
ncbi:MAG: glycoside hydrolase family 88 protein [Bacteroidaceae bacterium]